MSPRRIAILGVGLLGGSLGLALRRRVTGCEIIGYAHNAETGRRALEMGAIDRCTQDPAAAVLGVELVVLCTPVGLFSHLLEQIASHLDVGAIVTDVGSTKASVCAAGERLLPKHAHFVGSHPMAGSEKRGVEFARAELFEDALCILTPTAATDAWSLGRIEEFWKRLGMRTTQMPPSIHDELIAQVSHVPHAVAAALVMAATDAALPLAGKGFFDTTRIAGGDGGLWRDILLDNAKHVRVGIAQVQELLSELDEKLKSGDGEALRAWLDTAAAKREAAVKGRGPGKPDAV